MSEISAKVGRKQVTGALKRLVHYLLSEKLRVTERVTGKVTAKRVEKTVEKSVQKTTQKSAQKELWVGISW